MEENQNDQQQSSDSSLNQDPNNQQPAAAEGDKDEHGVPYKNRYMEAERKLKRFEDEQRRLQGEIDAMKTKIVSAPAEAAEEEEPWETRAREIARQERAKERQALNTMNERLNLLSEDEDIGDLVKTYRSRIEAQVEALSMESRMNPAIIDRVTRLVIGDNIAEIKRKLAEPSAPKAEGKRLTPVTTGGGGSGSGASKGAADLTADEVDYATKRGYFDKGFTNDEIKKSFRKYKERRDTK